MSEKTLTIHVSVSETIEGEVLLALNRAGGVIIEVRRQGELSTGLGATVPTQNLPTFAKWLREFSKDQGHISEGPQ